MEINFGKILKSARLDRGLTQAKLAEMCGVTQSTIGVWENGINVPSAENLYALAKALNMSTTILRAAVNGEVVILNDITPKAINTGSPSEAYTRGVSTTAPRNNHEQDISEIRSILEPELLDFGWGMEIKGRSGIRWKADIVAKHFIVNFKTAINVFTLKSALLNMVAMKNDTKDDRFYSLIVLIPPNLEGRLSLKVEQKKLQTLAGLVGVALEFTSSPKEAAETVVAFCRFSGEIREVDFYDDSPE